MLTGDLAHDREPEPGTSRRLSAGDAKKRRENTLAFAGRYAWTVVCDGDHGIAHLASDTDLDRRMSMPLSVLDEVTDHAAKQHAISGRVRAFAGDDTLVVAGGLLGSERKQVDFFASFQALRGVEAAREQDLVYQRIEFCDILFPVRACAVGRRAPSSARRPAGCVTGAYAARATRWPATACARRPVPRCARPTG